jgi:hypothetical protein
MTRIQLANYFKQQAFEAIGINQQRLGGPIAQQTATGVTQALNQSYAQTEIYFNQHSDHLMPRVHQMKIDLAQFYQSSNPSVRLSYITTEAEKVNFVINGTDLLLRDFNIFATTKTNHRAILDQLKQLAVSNNTTGASIFDLGNIIKADSIAEVTDILKNAEQKQTAIRQQEMQTQKQMSDDAIKAGLQKEQMKLEFDATQKEKDRQTQVLVAEIRAAGYGASQDIDQNMMSDYRDAMKDIKESTQYQEQMNFKREQAAMANSTARKKLDVEESRLATQRDIANTNLEIARENKNKYDMQDKPKKKNK